MSPEDSETEALVERAARGDQSAIDRLLGRHRDRLRRMIAVRMDPRLRSRVDPSDVVQETLMEAARQLPSYAQEPRLPFYPWLRGIAWQRLVDMHRRHVGSRKRGADREQPADMQLPDESAEGLAEALATSGTSPSGRIIREELRQRVRAALEQLSAEDREVLVLRHLEQLKVKEIAAILGIDEAAVKMRRLRAIRRLHRLLDRESH